MQTPWRRSSSRKRPRVPYGNLIAFIRERLRDAPEDLRLRRSLATHLGRARRYDEAIEEAKRLIEMAPARLSARGLLIGLKLHRLLRY